MLGPVDVLLFDLDGTLIDSTAAVTRSWTAWAGEYGLDAEQLVAEHGVPAAQKVARVLAADRAAGGQRRIAELELADVEGVVAYPGAVDLLAGLPRDAWGVVTSCTADLAAVRIAAAGLPAPPLLVTAEETAQGKPAPDPYLLGAERAGADPGRCLVVEDAPAGIASARAAGMPVLAVRTTHAADRLAADLVVPGLEAIDVRRVADGLLVGARH